MKKAALLFLLPLLFLNPVFAQEKSEAQTLVKNESSEETPVKKQQLSPGKIKKTLRDILAGKEFNRRKDNSESFLKLLFEEFPVILVILTAFAEFMQSIFNILTTKGSAQTAAIFLLLLILIFFFGVIYYFFVKKVRKEEKTEPGIILQEKDLTSVSYEALTKSALEKKDYKNAVRYGYFSALLFLHENNRLEFAVYKTDLEYLRETSDQPGINEPLVRIIRTFENIWYGLSHATEADTAEIQKEFLRLKGGVS
ncbi:MAG: hypothetical protein A2231_01935 [Candidatus Firestonebacteria bacterium RIFOXYA2_FULL_40_8]|nr:MAG: hypothetical protein A2231_01935 [Candidatus Firestonebacteria bacterium RIFOXYA2_FULL_40_8]